MRKSSRSAAGNGTVAQNTGVDVVSNIALPANQTLTGYDFIEVQPATISGTVWVDENNDGIINSGEMKLANVAIALTGTNDLGLAVSLNTTTDASGNYNFNVRPGNYTLSETQPAGYLQGKDISGLLGGNVTVQDVISAIQIPGCDGDAPNYNFGERTHARLHRRHASSATMTSAGLSPPAMKRSPASRSR